ncbi:MAG: hypothetical protein R3B49_10215 [Phycisphaerales bacterium]
MFWDVVDGLDEGDAAVFEAVDDVAVVDDFVEDVDGATGEEVEDLVDDVDGHADAGAEAAGLAGTIFTGWESKCGGSVGGSGVGRPIVVPWAGGPAGG